MLTLECRDKDTWVYRKGAAMPLDSVWMLSERAWLGRSNVSRYMLTIRRKMWRLQLPPFRVVDEHIWIYDVGCGSVTPGPSPVLAVPSIRRTRTDHDVLYSVLEMVWDGDLAGCWVCAFLFRLMLRNWNAPSSFHRARLVLATVAWV